MKRTAPFHLAIGSVVLLGATAFSTARAVEPNDRETITIKGRTYDVVADAQLRAMGFEPVDVAPDENAATYYLQAFEAYQSLKDADGLRELREQVLRDGWTDDAAALVPYLEANEKTLNLLKQAAAAPDCRFPILVAQGAPVNAATISGALLPQLASMRELARFALTAGGAREAANQFAQAIEAYELAIRIGNDLARSPFLVSGLAGLACNALGFRQIERCLVAYGIDEATLAKAQERFHELSEHAPDFMAAIRGERVFSMTEDMGAMTAQAREDAREFWTAMDKALGMPLPEFVEKQPGDELARQAEARKLPLNAIALLGAALQHGRVSYARDELSWTVLDTEFSLARYAAEHGQYPESLDALRDLMLSEGIDPFSGKPLGYRLEDDGAYTIWSVGEDLTDDGGAVGSRCPDWQAEDFVWNSAVIHGEDED